MEAKTRWSNIFQVLKEKQPCRPRIVYLATQRFKSGGEIKILPDKQKLVESACSRTALPETLKKILQAAMKGC